MKVINFLKSLLALKLKIMPTSYLAGIVMPTKSLAGIKIENNANSTKYKISILTNTAISSIISLVE